MKAIALAICAALVGCAAPYVSDEQLALDAKYSSSLDLCNIVIRELTGPRTRRASVNELETRHEDCTKFVNAIAVRVQSEAAQERSRQAGINNGLNLLQMAQPQSAIQPGAGIGSGLIRQSVQGTTRVCTYQNGLNTYTLNQPNLAPCP